MVTALYAALLALLLFILSIRVIGLRGNPAFAFIAQSRGDDELLQRAIRAHGNFTEYVPTMLILLYFLETSGLPTGLSTFSRGSVSIRPDDARGLHGIHAIKHAPACWRHRPHSSALTGRRRGAAQRGCYAVAPIQALECFPSMRRNPRSASRR